MISLANAGVPMLFWQLPFMAMALVPIVLIEWAIVSRLISGMSWHGFWSVGLANAVSTFIGIPLAWGAMLALNVATTGTGSRGLDTPMQVFQSVVLQASWLVPYEDDLYWMIPTATLVLLVPYFLVSVFAERWVLGLMMRNVDRLIIRKAAWRMNAVTYGMFVLGTGIGLWRALVG